MRIDENMQLNTTITVLSFVVRLHSNDFRISSELSVRIPPMPDRDQLVTHHKSLLMIYENTSMFDLSYFQNKPTYSSVIVDYSHHRKFPMHLRKSKYRKKTMWFQG